jgi:DNA-directed RNA polymerase specialized sigma24 family protein
MRNSNRFIQHFKTGDASSIEELVQTYQSSLFRIALLILDDQADADEAVQVAFSQPVSHRTTFAETQI